MQLSRAAGLERFIIRGGGLCEGDVQSARPRASYSNYRLVDGNSLAWRMFELAEDSASELDQLDECERQVRLFLKQMSIDSKETIIVLQDRQRELTGSEDTAERTDYAQLERMLPIAQAETIRSVANSLDLKVFIRSCSIHESLVALSSSLACPVVSEDGYFLKKSYKHGVVQMGSVCGSSDSWRLFGINHSRSSCIELDIDLLGLIYALVRIREKESGERLRVLRLVQNRLDIVGAGDRKQPMWIRRWNERVLAAVWSHLSHSTYEEAREYVLSLADANSQDILEKIIDEGPFDLEHDRATRELRATLEDLCVCPKHHRVKVENWLEFLHNQVKWSEKCSTSLFKGLRNMEKNNEQRLSTQSGANDIDRQTILLRVLHCSVGEFKRHCELCGAKLDQPIERLFFALKLLLYANDIEDPRRSLSEEFKQATLSSLIFYLGARSDFLSDFRDKLVATIDLDGHRLRTPLKSLSACDWSTIMQLKRLIELIHSFNKLNALLANPMQRIWPENWLNPCLIYNLTEDPGVLGYDTPAAIKDAFK